MATRYDEVTELKFYDVKDVMRILKVSKSKAYKMIAKINAVCEANGKFTVHGKVNAATFHTMF